MVWLPIFINLIGDRGGGKTTWAVQDQCTVHEEYPELPVVSNIPTTFDDGTRAIHKDDILKWLAIKTTLAASKDPDKVRAGRLYANVNLDEAAIQGLESRGSASRASTPNTYLLALSRKINVDLKLLTQLMCLPKGTLVQTPKGNVPIEEIRKGDSVIDNTYWGEKERMVLASVKSFQSELFEITLEDGHSIKATPRHRFPVHVNAQIKKDVAVADLKVGDMLKIDDWKHSCGIESLACLLGIIHAEGNFRISQGMNEVNQLTIAIDARESDLKRFILDEIKYCFPQSHVGIKRQKGTNQLALVLSKKDHTQFFYTRYREFITKPHTELFMRSFLRGFFEGDGCVETKSKAICLVQSGKNLAKLQIAMDYLNILGIPFNVYSAFRKVGGIAAKYAKHDSYEAYYLKIKSAYAGTFANTIGFISDNKRQKLQALTKNIYAKVIKILPLVGDFEVYDLQVKGAPYFMANGIRSHNSMIDKRGQWISDYDVLCEASAAKFFENGIEYPMRFDFRIYKNLRLVNIKHLDGGFAKEWLYPKFDTNDVPLSAAAVKDFISFFEIKPNDYTDYRRDMGVLP